MNHFDLVGPAEAKVITGITCASQFWKVVRAELAKNKAEYQDEPPMFRYSARNVRFRRSFIELLRDKHKVSNLDDLRRLCDGRRRA